MVSYHEIGEAAVRLGGVALMERFGNVTVRLKSPADLVTDADLASQKVIADFLHDALPGHEVLGEEDSPDQSHNPLDAEYCWVVDPLDGTTNFAHQVPHFSVSLALVERGELRVGSVFDPMRNELFSAARNEGARLNGTPIRTSRVERIEDALAGIGFPPQVDERSPDFQAFVRAVSRFQALRRTGSAALNLAYVAAGRFDASWSYSTRIWDMAAGTLLVREAGGVVGSPSGGPMALRSGRFLASANERLGREITQLLSTVPQRPDR